MQSAQAGTTSPEDNDFDIALRLCDDEGWVSHKPIELDTKTLDKSYLERHTRLAGPTLPSGDKRKGWPFTDGEGWGCTGHAHYGGLHIRCTSPAHRQGIPVNQIVTGLSVAPLSPPKISRCPHCFQELVPMDIGYGDSTRLACPEHGWNRYPILSIPRWIEDDIRRFPELARRYVEWLTDGGE